MKYVLLAWLSPLLLFWGWFFLSLNDINFGTTFFSRQLHDLLFEVYGNILGLDPATIPWLVAKACILDTLILLAIWAFRRRKAIMEWYRTKRNGMAADPMMRAMSGADDRAPLEG